MTPQFEAAIAAIQQLSPLERQQLLQVLIQSNFSANDQTALRSLSTQFQQGATLKQLLAAQTPVTVNHPRDLRASFWPEADSIEEFLDFLQQQRQEII
jgi:hypothetical protein